MDLSCRWMAATGQRHCHRALLRALVPVGQVTSLPLPLEPTPGTVSLIVPHFGYF